MARLPRVYIEGVLYYVTSKSGHNQDLFTAPSDYQDYISLVSNYKNQYGFRLFSYVLMQTHLHMLIELRNDVAISNIMHDINSLYTKSYNSRYGTKGHLFQERFKTLLAEKEPYLLPIIRHIHLTPKRNSLAERPGDYPYSSHRQFLDPAKRDYPDMREEIEEVFRLLNGREKEFEDYVSSVEKKAGGDSEKTLRKKRILGSKAFKERVEKAIEEAVKQQKKEPGLKRSQRVYMTVSGIAVMLLAVLIAHFYRQQTALISKFDKTIMVHERTLAMLKNERDKAVKADKDIEEYQWKIRLAEESLADLKEKREEAEKTAMQIEGYLWGIALRQIGGPEGPFDNTDTIYFEDGRMHSANMGKEGFPSAAYSRRELKDGKTAWDTLQKKESGETAGWHGRWDGAIMKGVLSERSADGTVRDFSFVSMGERRKK